MGSIPSRKSGFLRPRRGTSSPALSFCLGFGILLFFPFSSPVASGEYRFGADRRISGDPALVERLYSASPGQRSIAARGNAVYVTWGATLRDTLLEAIYFTRSTDGGTTFAPPQRLFVMRRPFDDYSAFPVIALGPESTVFVSWRSYRNVLLCPSDDGGRSFGRAVIVQHPLEPYEYYFGLPSVAASPSGKDLYVTYSASTRTRLPEQHILLSHSSSLGESFDPPVQVDDVLHILPLEPLVAVAPDGTLHLIWEQQSYLGNYVRLSRSFDRGRTLEPSLFVFMPDDFTTITAAPSGALYLTGSYPGLYSPYPANIRFLRSLDRGETFEPPVVLDRRWAETSIAVSPEGVIGAVWQDYLQEFGGTIFMSASFDGGETFTHPVVVDDNSAKSAWPSIAMGPGARAYVIFLDGRDGGWRGLYCDAGVPGGTQRETSSALARRERLTLSAAPNPFSGSTEIRFEGVESAGNSPYQVEILDVTGRRLRSWSGSGTGHGLRLRWDGTDGDGRRLPPGVYLARLTTAGWRKDAKVILTQ